MRYAISEVNESIIIRENPNEALGIMMETSLDSQKVFKETEELIKSSTQELNILVNWKLFSI
jgi:hypothetical protein